MTKPLLKRYCPTVLFKLEQDACTKENNGVCLKQNAEKIPVHGWNAYHFLCNLSEQ